MRVRGRVRRTAHTGAPTVRDADRRPVCATFTPLLHAACIWTQTETLTRQLNAPQRRMIWMIGTAMSSTVEAAQLPYIRHRPLPTYHANTSRSKTKRFNHLPHQTRMKAPTTHNTHQLPHPTHIAPKNRPESNMENRVTSSPQRSMNDLLTATLNQPTQSHDTMNQIRALKIGFAQTIYAKNKANWQDVEVNDMIRSSADQQVHDWS